MTSRRLSEPQHDALIAVLLALIAFFVSERRAR
jgi:hypothetical protein